VEIEEARLRARAEPAESDAQLRESVAENRASEQILTAQQELEVLRRQSQADVERTRLEANGAISKAKSEGERTVQEAAVALQKLKNVSNVTLEAEAPQRAMETPAAGEGEAVRILQDTQNDLLQQKVQLLAQAGGLGKIALFVQQQPHLFEAYQQYARGLEVDNLAIMDDKRGFNSVVNRDPEALVDFLRHFEAGFGVRVRDLLTASTTPRTVEERLS
jgi:flotillin